ncbi:hypothetical protein BGW80DRAFT_1461675 [Lactifluus volemus]|nr:hypothetical protein BGW80DRAFT_1461675 [Lactifluus volemus]
MQVLTFQGVKEPLAVAMGPSRKRKVEGPAKGWRWKRQSDDGDGGGGGGNDNPDNGDGGGGSENPDDGDDGDDSGDDDPGNPGGNNSQHEPDFDVRLRSMLKITNNDGEVTHVINSKMDATITVGDKVLHRWPGPMVGINIKAVSTSCTSEHEPNYTLSRSAVYVTACSSQNFVSRRPSLKMSTWKAKQRKKSRTRPFRPPLEQVCGSA